MPAAADASQILPEVQYPNLGSTYRAQVKQHLRGKMTVPIWREVRGEEKTSLHFQSCPGVLDKPSIIRRGARLENKTDSRASQAQQRNEPKKGSEKQSEIPWFVLFFFFFALRVSIK